MDYPHSSTHTPLPTLLCPHSVVHTFCPHCRPTFKDILDTLTQLLRADGGPTQRIRVGARLWFLTSGLESYRMLPPSWDAAPFLPASCVKTPPWRRSLCILFFLITRQSVLFIFLCPQVAGARILLFISAPLVESQLVFCPPPPQVAVKRHGLSAQDYSNAAAAGGPSTVGGRSRAPAAASGIGGGGGDGDSDADLGGINSAILVAAADGTCTSFAPFMTEEAGDGAATRSSAAPRPPASVSASRRPSENSAILVAAADGTRVSFVPFIKEELSEELAGAALTARPLGAADGGPARSSAADGGGRAAMADAAEGGGRAAMADAADRSRPSENSAIFVSPVDGSFASFAPLRKSPPKR